MIKDPKARRSGFATFPFVLSKSWEYRASNCDHGMESAILTQRFWESIEFIHTPPDTRNNNIHSE